MYVKNLRKPFWKATPMLPFESLQLEKIFVSFSWFCVVLNIRWARRMAFLLQFLFCICKRCKHYRKNFLMLCIKFISSQVILDTFFWVKMFVLYNPILPLSWKSELDLQSTGSSPNLTYTDYVPWCYNDPT